MSNPCVIVFSHLRWDFVYQRPQHLMSRLSRHWRVVFIEEPMRCEGPPGLEAMQPHPGVTVLRPRTSVDAPGFHDAQISVVKPLVDEYLRATGVEDCVAWFYTPMALPLLTGLKTRAVVYDCMDELASFKGAPRQMKQRESALLKTADLVLAGGPSLYEAKRGANPHVHCFPSGVDAQHFSPGEAVARDPHWQLAEQQQRDIPTPRLGYLGVIDERVDTTLLAALADADPRWQVVMVGPVAKIDPHGLPRRANIHYLGKQPYERLPGLVAGWDVCLLPFAVNEATRYISPTKTLEYMAAEKPIVSTPIRDVIGMYGDVVRFGHDTGGFVEACRQALNESPQQRMDRVAEMLGCVMRLSWDETAHTVHGLLLDAIDRRQRLSSAARASVEPPPAVPLAPPGHVTGPADAVREVRHLVIGAGPTGLAAAYHLGAQALLVERENRVGGWCRSVVDRGFTFDHAGHIMFSNDPYVLELYDKLLGDNVHWQDREAWIYSKGVYTRYPFQGSLYGLPPQVLKECLIGAIEARFGPLKGPGREPGAAVVPPAAPCNPPGGFGLTCEITYSPSKPLPCEGDALIARVIEDCKHVGMLREDDPILCAHQVDMPGAYVVYDHARAGHVARIRQWLSGHGVILAGRYAEWEYYNSDHAFLAGKRAAEAAIAQSARRTAAQGPQAQAAGA